jgi:response regulator of citrate/malate metabolism
MSFNVVFIDDEINGSLKNFKSNVLKPYPQFEEIYEFAHVLIAKDFLLARSKEIDIAIIDHFIGNERGTDLGGWISENCPHIACILLTGGGSETQMQNDSMLDIAITAMEKGFCAFLLKSKVLDDSEKLYKNFDRILDLSSVKAKQKAKSNMLRADNAEENLRDAILSINHHRKTNLNESHYHLPMQMKLDIIEKVITLFKMKKNLDDKKDIIQSYVVAGFEFVEKKLCINWNELNSNTIGRNPSLFDTAKLVHKNIQNFEFTLNDEDSECDSYIMINKESRVVGSRNPLKVQFKVKEKEPIGFLTENALIVSQLLSKYPEKWENTRNHYSPIKEIIKEVQ